MIVYINRNDFPFAVYLNAELAQQHMADYQKRDAASTTYVLHWYLKVVPLFDARSR